MAAFTDELKNHILKWEGGLSRAKTDAAKSNAAPCTHTYKGVTANDWHTNKGIQWLTFKSAANELNYDPECSLFFEMPDSLWLKIAKKQYWDKYNLDQMPSQALANLIFQAAWGMGLSGSAYLWGKFFGKSFANYSDITKTFAEYLSKYSEKDLFTKAWKYKLDYYLKLPNQEANYSGWTNRANDFYSFNESTYLGKNKTAKVTIDSIVINLGILIAAWFLGSKLGEQ